MIENEATMWRCLTGMVGSVMIGWVLHAWVLQPPGPPAPPEPPPAVSWSVIVGTRENRHLIEIRGRDDPELIRAALARDASCPSPEVRVRDLEQQNGGLLGDQQRLALQVRELTMENGVLRSSLAHDGNRAQRIIEAVVRSGGGSYDWDDQWLAHYGLVRTWAPRVSLWQNHLKDEVPLAECRSRD